MLNERKQKQLIWHNLRITENAMRPKDVDKCENKKQSERNAWFYQKTVLSKIE